METFLYIVFFISCLVLIGSVLLQPGKTDAGALFTTGVSQAALNPRGTASVLSKLTIGAATVFMLSALFLSLPALSGGVSVMDTSAGKAKAATPAPASNGNQAAPAANANAASVPAPAKENKPPITEQKANEKSQGK